MFRTIMIGAAGSIALATVVSAQAQFGSALEARAMLERMVAAVKVDKAKALDQMQKARRDSRFAISMPSVPT